MFDLSAEQILTHLFHEEAIRIFDLQSIHYSFEENPAKIYTMLCLLEREEINSILREFSEVVVSDNFRNREYRLSAMAIDATFHETWLMIH